MPTKRPPAPAGAGRAARRLLPFIAIVAIATAACAQPTGSAASPTPTLGPSPSPAANPYDGVAGGAGKGVKIGYVSYGELIPFVFQVSEGIRAQAALAGAELVECDTGLRPDNVPGCMKKLTDAGVQGVIQFQGDLADAATTCNETPSGVPVVAVEFPQDPCAKAVVAADDLRAGQVAGRAVGEWVKARWSCTYDAYVSLESTAAADKSRLRMEGYQQGFSAVCPITNLQVGRSSDTEPQAKTDITSLLGNLAGKSRIVVVAVNDDAALGALDAATAAGRASDVWVSGQGAEARVRDLIRTDEHYIGDAAYFPERYGRTIVPALLDLIAGKTVPAELLIEPAWVDATTIATIYPQ